MLEINNIYNQECLSGMANIKDKSIDMVLADLPYLTTQNSWESLIPLNDYVEINVKNKLTVFYQDAFFLYSYKNNISFNDAALYWSKNSKKGLWSSFDRIVKDDGAIILTADGSFTAKLMSSNLKMFKYKLIWNKISTTGFLNAKRMPLRQHEDILVFYKKPPVYNPKMEIRGKPRIKGGYHNKREGTGDMCYGEFKSQTTMSNEYYPTSIINISNANQANKMHPTQKPVELFKYLIETYSKEGDIILDTCMGSGTTAIAAIESNRNFIGFELDLDYFNYSEKRIVESIKNKN